MKVRRRELLEAILARPDDDDLRLVYADVLAEEGDSEQAEFIQGAIALHRAHTKDAALHARVEALSTKHGTRFAGPIAEHAKSWSFERGLVSEIRVDPLVLSAHAELLLSCAPVRRISLDAPSLEHAADLDDELKIACEAATLLASCPHLSRITEMDAGDGSFGPMGDEDAAGLQCFLASPHLTNLATLIVDSYGQPGAAPSIAAAHARLPALRTLTFVSSSGTSVGDAGAIALAASPLCARLEVLEIWGGDVGADGAAALARSLNRIRRLALGPVWYANNEIGPEGARGLAAATGLSNLEYLHLGGNGIRDEGLAALADARWLANVTELELSDNGLTDRGLEALAASPYNTSIRRLRIASGTHGSSHRHRNDFSATGLRALEALPRLKQLAVGKEHETETTLSIPITRQELDDLFTD